MLPFIRKSIDRSSLAALAVTEHGVGMARVHRAPDRPPVLEACEHIPSSDPEGQSRAVEALGKRHHLTRRLCSLVIESSDYAILQIEAPDVPAEELREAARWRVRDVVDFPVEDAVIDVFDVPPLKGQGRAPMIFVVAARVAEVGARLAPLLEAGFALEVIDIPELAQRNLAAALPEDAAGVAVLRLLPASGLITLTRQGALYLARRFDYGHEVLRPLAEEGVGASDDRVSRYLDSLAVEVQRSLDFYESNFALAPITVLAIAPMPFEIAGMSEYLGVQLGLSVRGLDLNEVIDAGESLGPDLQWQCFEAIGAALRHEPPTP